MKSPQASHKGIRTRLSNMAILLYVMGGMCAALGATAFFAGQFNEAAILYLATMGGIGMAALLDRNRVE